MGNIRARQQEILRILRGNQGHYITMHYINDALPEHLHVGSLRTIRRDLTDIYEDNESIEFQQGRYGGVKYIGGKYARLLSFEQKGAIEKSIERANAEEDNTIAQILQGLLDLFA